MIRQRRAEDIDQHVGRWLANGGGALLLSLTVPHYRPDRLAPRLDLMAAAIDGLLKGRPWERRRDALGYVGAIRALEITYGDANGWHPHNHALLLTERPISTDEQLDLWEWLYGRWAGVCERHGFGTPSRAHGLDLRQVWGADGLSSYLTTVEGGWGIGRELARGDLKRGRDRLVPLDLLRALIETGEARMAALWVEYELATAGKRAVRWGPGLRERLQAGVEASDEELAASEGLDQALIVQRFGPTVWNGEARAGRLARVLELCEQEAARQIAEADAEGRELPVLTIPKGDR